MILSSYNQRMSFAPQRDWEAFERIKDTLYVKHMRSMTPAQRLHRYADMYKFAQAFPPSPQIELGRREMNLEERRRYCNQFLRSGKVSNGVAAIPDAR